MIPMFKQKVGMTKIYAKGIAELFLIRCNPYHWDGSGEGLLCMYYSQFR